MYRMIFVLAALGSMAQVPSSERIGEARGAALQADARHALQLLDNVDTASLSAKDRKFVTCMRERFASDRQEPSVSNGFADRALSVYRTYWHASLVHPDQRDEEEKRLDRSLRRLLGTSKSHDLDSILKRRLGAVGVHSLEGRTGLLRELMMWRTQKEVETTVALPEGKFRVTVAYLDGFTSLGWSYYATCGLAATGGWTDEHELYVVVPRYDSLEGEEFQVSFLGHETQHFADKTRFPNLKAWELEYRAKLVELALADQTRSKILARFIDDQGENPAEPHSYADRKVLVDLVSRLELQDPKDLYGVDLQRLHSAARAALRADTEQRESAARRPLERRS